MKRKLLTIFSASALLTGCSVSADDSNIQYNKIYESKKVSSLGCGRGNQLTYKENDVKKTLNLRQTDCLYLIEHKKHLKRLGEKDDLYVTFISDGEFIDGITIDESK